jgi:hypothetical protein
MNGSVTLRIGDVFRLRLRLGVRLILDQGMSASLGLVSLYVKLKSVRFTLVFKVMARLEE